MKTAGTDLTVLRVFDAVARHGGFAAAQPELNINPSTISNHIRALEARLGVRLCKRGREGFLLTEQGEIVLAAARRLFQSLDDFALDVGELRQQLVGQLRIGLVDSIVTDPGMHLAEAIARFKSQPNAVTIEITEDPPQVLQQKVRSGDRHLGIGSFPHKMAGLTYEPLYVESHSLYCADRHPLFAVPEARLALAAVRAEVIVSRGYWREEFVRNLGFENIGALVYQIEPQLILILSGHYLGFLPDHYARPWVAAGRLRAIAPQAISYPCTFDLVTRRDAPTSRMIATFLDLLRAAQGVATPPH
ncbi:MAG: LysR family transcriptional regulator [Pseudorhodobacter sp.]|nr:LysR family transcriptional regulator [Pseudorhodobacter sp.]